MQRQRNRCCAALAPWCVLTILLGCQEAPPVDKADAPTPSDTTIASEVPPKPSPAIARSPPVVAESKEESAPAAQTKTPATLEAATTSPAGTKLVPWSEERLAELLAKRVDGGVGHNFRGFSNQFLVMCRIQIGSGVALTTNSREIALAELQPVFPESYRPTLRELFDTLALQTKSTWRYDPTDKHFQSDVPGAVTDLAIFEFTAAKHEHPYEVTLSEGWKAEDQGHWLMLIPPDFPVGLDIYQVGTYSADDKAEEAKLFEKVRTDVSLQWAERVAEGVTAEKLKPAKVGPYEALYFESMIPSQLGKDIRWRQWVFMAEDRCFFVVSTILPELDKKIFPDVEKTLETFRLLPPKANATEAVR